MTNEEKYRRALLAIRARIQGVWDQPDLVAFGPLNTCETSDVLEIAQDALREDW
jgi:hypothetical protein